MDGQGGIRTHETLTGLLVFKTSAFNRSATCPALHSTIAVAGEDRIIAHMTGPAKRSRDGEGSLARLA